MQIRRRRISSFRLVQFLTQQLQASVSLRRCIAAALYTSMMATLTVVDEITSLSPHVKRIVIISLMRSIHCA